MGQGLVLARYSTTHLPEADRHEAWTNRDWPSLAPVYRTLPGEPFDIRSVSLRLEDVGISYAQVTGQRWIRDAAMMRSHDADALTVAITQSGEAHGLNAGRAFRSGPGSVHFLDLSVPSDHVSSASRTMLIILPRCQAEQNGLDVRRLNGLVLDRGPAGLIAPYLFSLLRAAPDLPVEEAPRMARILLDLLGVATAPSLREAKVEVEGRRRVVALAARQEIETSLCSPSLGIASLCRRLGVSRSTLHRLFEAEGGVQAYIRHRRLEAARAALAEPGNPEPISAIAERLGFSDGPHLSRLFRERYDISPRDYRMKARSQRRG